MIKLTAIYAYKKEQPVPKHSRTLRKELSITLMVMVVMEMNLKKTPFLSNFLERYPDDKQDDDGGLFRGKATCRDGHINWRENSL